MHHACSTCASECVSGVVVHLLKSSDSVNEGHVLLNAGFLSLDAYPEIKLRKCDTPTLPHKLSSGKTSPQQCKHIGCGIWVL